MGSENNVMKTKTFPENDVGTTRQSPFVSTAHVSYFECEIFWNEKKARKRPTPVGDTTTQCCQARQRLVCKGG